MKVQVWLWGHLTQYIPGEQKGKFRVVEIREGATIGNVLEHLKIPQWAVNLLFRNGEYATDSEILQDGDRMTAFPRLLSGG
jgi:molybdopterin converting factor small subunit